MAPAGTRRPTQLPCSAQKTTSLLRKERELQPGQYLTASFPELPADQMRAVQVAPRMSSVIEPSLEPIVFEEDDDK